MAKCSNLLLLTLSFQVIGILIPYISVLQKNIFSPPLPFISQTVGFSPECGIFTFFLVPGSFFGIILCFIIHKTCKIQGQELMENASFFFGTLYFLSWVFLCASPFTFTDLPNKYEWVLTVLSVHMFGALLMLASSVFFVISQAMLYWNCEVSPDHHPYRCKMSFFTAPAAFIGIFALAALGFEELSNNEGQTMEKMIYLLPTKLSSKYIVTALCEWTLTFSMWFTLLTYYNEMDKKKFYLKLKRKTL
ncbi:uncharacterized protein TNIN_122641 [Trichonephila inaurata madagascariensis]|uniref:CWH43-like N-terminal domain-containing protein n=1 Tax=Trichonephila inaurata madagascariensis TaxID=2747483 RepID=A0A8X7BW23_9ARAC|nr:uncharacterized protein TNIN_122641 [Trichonephila inaurata madagascariensis]